MGEITAGDNCLGKSKRGTNQRPPNTRPKPLDRVATTRPHATSRFVLKTTVKIELPWQQKKRNGSDATYRCMNSDFD